MTEISSKVAANSFFIYFGRIVNLAITFFVFVYLANYLGENSFGRLSLAITYVGMFDILANFGLNQILVREISTGGASSQTLLGAGIFIKVVLTLASFILSGSMALILDYPKEMLILIWIIAINFFISSKLSSTRSVFESIFQARLQMVYPIAFNVVDNVLFAVLIYFFTLRYHINLISIAFIYTFCNLPGAILLLIQFLKTTSINITMTARIIKKLILESLPLALYLCFSILNTRMDIVLLSWMKGESDIGYYAAATRLVYPLTFLSTSFSISLFPLLSRYFLEDKLQFLKTVNTGIKYISLIAIALCVCFSINSSKIISTLYIPSYAPCISPFAILILSLGLTFLNFYFLDIFIATKQQKVATIVTALSFGANVILNLILIPKHGILGASYSRLASSVVSFIVFHWLMRKRLGLCGTTHFTKMISLVIIYGALQLVFKNFNLIFTLTASAIFFFMLIFVLKVIDEEEIKYLKSVFQPSKIQKLFHYQ
jgi:O-antigen/teichoic acid export membrane protein